MQPILSTTNLEGDEELIKLLEQLGSLRCEYPPKLFTARRTAFITQVDQRQKIRLAHQFHSKDTLIQGRDR
jgi:hypothetical protein